MPESESFCLMQEAQTHRVVNYLSHVVSTARPNRKSMDSENPLHQLWMGPVGQCLRNQQLNSLSQKKSKSSTPEV